MSVVTLRLSDDQHQRLNVNGGVKLGHVAAQNWATLDLGETWEMGAASQPRSPCSWRVTAQPLARGVTFGRRSGGIIQRRLTPQQRGDGRCCRLRLRWGIRRDGLLIPLREKPARVKPGPGDINTGSAERLDRGASLGPDHRFTVSKSGRDSLRQNDGTAKQHLSRAAMGTNVPPYQSTGSYSGFASALTYVT